jgi:hypothetical protein
VAHELSARAAVAPAVRPLVPSPVEAGDRVVEPPDQRGDLRHRRVGREEVEVVRVHDVAGHEREDLPAPLVDAEEPRRAVEPRGLQVTEQRVDARRPGPCRAADGVAHPHDHVVGVPAPEGLLVHPVIVGPRCSTIAVALDRNEV